MNRRWLVVLGVGLTFSVGCVSTPPPTLPEIRTAHVVIPAMNVAVPANFDVSAASIEEAAVAECALGATSTSFFGVGLGGRTMNTLLTTTVTDSDARVLFGDLLVSGYFGGRVLRETAGVTELLPNIAGLDLGSASVALLDTVVASGWGSTDASTLVPILVALSASLATYNNGSLPAELSSLVSRLSTLTAVALGQVAAAALGDQAAAARVARAQVGVIIWIGAYVMGLSGDTALAELNC